MNFLCRDISWEVDLILPLFVTSNLEREGEISICQHLNIPSCEQIPLVLFCNCPLIQIRGKGTTVKGFVWTPHMSCIDPHLEGKPDSAFSPRLHLDHWCTRWLRNLTKVMWRVCVRAEVGIQDSDDCRTFWSSFLLHNLSHCCLFLPYNIARINLSDKWPLK